MNLFHTLFRGAYICRKAAMLSSFKENEAAIQSYWHFDLMSQIGWCYSNYNDWDGNRLTPGGLSPSAHLEQKKNIDLITLE